MENKFILIQADHFNVIIEKLEKLENLLTEKGKQKMESDWITNKKFMEEVSIKAYNTFVKIKDKMPDSLKREINGKQYIHQDAVKRYFQGEFSKN